MLFTDQGPYLNESDKAILSQMEAFYTESITINQAFWQEADTDTRFEAGDQSLWNEIYGNLPSNNRQHFSFNRIRRVINMISGHQRRNRKSIIAVPVENADEETADQYSKILLWATQQESILETISDSFQGALVTGMNLLQVWMDYRSDPISGNIRVDNCPYNAFLIDPYFKKADLSDCNSIWKRSYLTKKECISLLPNDAEQIEGMSGNLSGGDGKFQYMPEAYNYGYKNLLAYDEYYYRDYRTQQMLVDSQTGECLEWRSQDEDALKTFLRYYPQVTMINQEIQTVKLAVVVEGKVFYNGPNPTGIENYPFVPVFAYYNSQMPHFPQRIQGVVRGLRDAQYLYNHRKRCELDIFESQINSGWIYKENALVNPKDVFLSGQGRGLALKDDANMTDVMQIQAPQVPPSMIQLSELLAREVMEISGVNEELLGSAVDDKAGVLAMLRQGAGLTTLQVLFDQLDRSQKLLGRLMIDMIQANFTPGKVKRIIEAEPAQQFYNKAFGKYDAAIEDGLNTTTQKQMQFAQLLQLREAGVTISNEDLLQAATIQDKKKIIENAIKQDQKASQLEQQQAQVAMEELKARTNLADARAQADRGLGMERVSRIEENRALAVERISESEKDKNVALLNFVKALKEIEGVDLMQLEKLVTLSKVIQPDEEEALKVNNTPMQNLAALE